MAASSPQQSSASEVPTQQEFSPEPGSRPVSRLARWAMAIAWPAFVMAGVMEALVFAVVDPGDLTWFGAERMDLSRQAVYTLSFLIFWGVISLASSISLALAALPDGPGQVHPRKWPQ